MKNVILACLLCLSVSALAQPIVQKVGPAKMANETGAVFTEVVSSTGFVGTMDPTVQGTDTDPQEGETGSFGLLNPYNQSSPKSVLSCVVGPEKQP